MTVNRLMELLQEVDDKERHVCFIGNDDRYSEYAPDVVALITALYTATDSEGGNVTLINFRIK